MSRVLSEEDELDEDKQEAETVFRTYLEHNHHDGIRAILMATNNNEHYPLPINAMEFFDTNMHIGQFLLKKPVHFLPVFEEALKKAQANLLESIVLSTMSVEASIKRNVHVRFSNLPVCPELTRINVPKSEDVGTFIAFSGTVIRTSLTKLLEHEKEYVCNKCKHIFTIHADFSQHFAMCQPSSCPSGEGCNSVKFTCFGPKEADSSNLKDYQEIKIQEQAQKLSVGTIPRAISVVLEDDLVDSCKAGDDVTVYGVVLRRWKPTFVDVKTEIELVIRANNLIVNNDHSSSISLTDDIKREFRDFWEEHELTPLYGRNKIIASICPQVFGLYLVKLAVALTLIGGVQRVSKTGTRVRGESHMLLVGDPGTGKSQFLKYAVKLMPRSVLTTGIGTTSAGLTVTAVRDSGEWQLEAGALVLADGGLCCIDEFNCIREHDKASIHEAMEQQTVSVAKAGLVCKLNTRATILAATNPKGNYDSEAPLNVNVGLASPLLSRFDVVLVLLDNRNEEWDRIVSSFVLDDARPGSESLRASKEVWAIDRMQTYFCYVRTRKPALTEDASRILASYYTAQRSADLRSAARTTLRLLESLVRIAQAHARLLYRDQVTVQDAVVAICIMESSMQNAGIFGGGLNPLHTSFPKDPDAEYLNQARVVLNGLKLYDVLQRVTELEDARKRQMKSRDQTDFSFKNTNKDDLSSRDIVEKTGEIAVKGTSSCETKKSYDPVSNELRSCLVSLGDSNKSELSSLHGLLTYNEIFDTPVAISANTPSLEKQADGGTGSHYTKLNTKTSNHRDHSVRKTKDSSTVGTDYTYRTEAYGSNIAKRSKAKEVPFSFKSTLEEAVGESSNLYRRSTELENSESDSAEPSQIILPSNLNHYPNIFALDDDQDDTFEENWPFSARQEGPTQILVKRKRTTNQISQSAIETFTKEVTFSNDIPNDTETATEGSGNSMNSHAKTFSNESKLGNNVTERLKQFKFRKIDRITQK